MRNSACYGMNQLLGSLAKQTFLGGQEKKQDCSVKACNKERPKRSEASLLYSCVTWFACLETTALMKHAHVSMLVTYQSGKAVGKGTKREASKII